jgi:hypothetical protein
MLFNGAQIHMLVNHLPVIGFLGMVLALAVAMKVQSIDIKRFVLLATVVVGASALAPYWTGESAEEVIEHLPGVSKDLIHEHEELAEKATVFSLITAVAAGVAFFLQGRRPETLRKSIPVVFVLSLVTAGVIGAAAHEGGKIRHPEINPDAGALPSQTTKDQD